MTDHEPTDDPLTWPLAAYGTVIRGDENTSEDQVAIAASPEVARRLVACWNVCSGVSTVALELGNFCFTATDSS